MAGLPDLLAVTGTRADFGIWRPVLDAAKRAGMRARLLVTAMHLDPRYGHTVDEVVEAGYEIAARVPCTAVGDSHADMSVALATCLAGTTPVIDKERPDWLLLLGDRGEQLAAGLAALHLGIPVAHLHGGERTLGAIDDVIRDLLSRIATLHFVATGDARQRLATLGIRKETVHHTGAPGLDAIATRDTAADESVRRRYGVQGQDYLMVLQHPETVGDADPVRQIDATLQAVHESGLPALAILPNADAGGRSMAQRLDGYGTSFVGIHPSIPRADFLALLSGAAAIVGNSSSGLIEAPMLRVPAVNVGQRQQGRTRGDNVLDVPAEPGAIAAAIRRALDPEFRAKLSGSSPYGDGRASERIVEVLRRTGRAH